MPYKCKRCGSRRLETIMVRSDSGVVEEYLLCERCGHARVHRRKKKSRSVGVA